MPNPISSKSVPESHDNSDEEASLSESTAFIVGKKTDLSQGASGAFRHLRMFLRGIFVLALLECVELALKSTEVHAVCNAPIVLAKRLERAQRANLTNFDVGQDRAEVAERVS